MRYFKLHTGKSPSASRRGYAGMIAMLIVLVIIFYLVLEGYLKQNPQTKVTEAETRIDRARELACAEDRKVLHDQIQQFQFSNGAALPSPAILRAKLGPKYHCPGKGQYQLDREGNVYCTEHFPPPESLTDKVFDLAVQE